MKDSAKLVRSLQVLILLALAALALWRHRQHVSQKGSSVSETAAVAWPLSAGEIASGRRSFEPKRWREAVGLLDGRLRLDSARMSWSSGGNQGCGYLYFTDHSTEPQWEFSACEQRLLKDVSLADAKREFVGANAPNGPTALRAHWTGSDALTVCEGTLLCARQVGSPQKVYVLEIAKQELDRIEIRYKVFDGVESLGH